MSQKHTYRRSDHPYPDYIDSIDQQEHKWLAEFLRLPDEEIEITVFDPDTIQHGIEIIDILQDGSFAHTSICLLSGHPSGRARTNPKLFDTLDNVPEECSTRILIAQEWSDVGAVHRGSHNAIGYKYKLPPEFFEMHFALSMPSLSPSASGFLEEDTESVQKFAPALSQSEQCFLQIKGSHWGILTATEVNSPGLQTFIILDCCDFGRVVKLALQSVLHLLNSLSEQEGIHDLRLSDLCGHHSRKCLRRISRKVFGDVWDCLRTLRRTKEDPQKLLSQHEQYRIFHQCLQFSSESIQRYLLRETGEVGSLPEQWKDILSDYKALMRDTERVALDLRNRLQVVQSSDAIEEARVGVRQAESVRRLTFVAFVFIPLSFATSLFGMNVTQLKGDVDVKWFVLTAVISGLIAAIIAGCVRFTNTKLPNALTRLRAEYKTKYADTRHMQTDSTMRMIYNKCIGHYLWKKYLATQYVLTMPNANDTTGVSRRKLIDVSRLRIYRKVVRFVAWDMLGVVRKYLVRMVPRFGRARSPSNEPVAV